MSGLMEDTISTLTAAGVVLLPGPEVKNCPPVEREHGVSGWNVGHGKRV